MKKTIATLSLGCLMGSAMLSMPLQAQSDEVQTAEDVPLELAGSDIRPEVGGLHGAVVSGHPLASQMGYEVLRNGGNAADAAVTMAAMLAVLRPHMNSVGGDAFALFYDAESKEVSVLNASGRSGALATPEYYRERGHERVPFAGALSVTVPGAVSAWDETLRRFGGISMEEALQPAIGLAETGFMVTNTLAADLASAAPRLNETGQAIYLPEGKPLQAGDILKSEGLAASLRMIAEQGPDAMYGGELGARIASFLEDEGSALRAADFEAHDAEWTSSVSIPFQDMQVHTVPPNSQGMVLLQMLAMAEMLPLNERSYNSPQLLHELAEITKIAFADRDRWVADPDFADAPLDTLLDTEYLADRLALLGDMASSEHSSGLESELIDRYGNGPNEGGDTIYLMVVDADGNAVSWIQSIFGSFGSGLVVPGTGIVMQNRGAGFSLEEGHPNLIAPGKRPFHTLMATLVTDADGELAMTIGTPGGGGQPQFIAQTLVKSLTFGLSPQQAAESPRYRTGSGTNLGLESRLPDKTIEALEAMGHEVEVTDGWTANFGNMMLIQRLPNGVLRTGADMRREAAAMAW